MGAGNNSNHIFISAREIARLGHLFLNQGNWDGKQLIPKDWVQKASAVQVPATLPLGHTESGGASLNLPNNSGTFTVDWYNPRTGGSLQKGKERVVEETYSREPSSVLSALPNIKAPRIQGGNVTDVSGPGWVNLGMPPQDDKEDWVILVRKR